MSKIDIISSSLVRMAAKNNYPPSVPQTLELTPWDLRLLPLDPIQKGVLLHKPADQSQQFIHRLKDSLAQTLDFFPPLAGRLGTVENDDKTVSFFIDCNNAGAEFTHAVVRNLSVSNILEAKYVPKIVSLLFPRNDSPNYEGTFKPLLSVQVTELVDGFFIGCSGNHAVIDGTSFWHFFNSWSEISRGLDTVSKLPVFKRWFPSNFPEKDQRIRFQPLDQKLSNKFSPPPLLERVFVFSKVSLAKLKAKANYEAECTTISTLQALSAHLWRAVIRSRRRLEEKTDDKEESYFYLIVGARARVPLPDGYFGNAAYIDKFTAAEQEIIQNGLGFAARKINELVVQQTCETAIKSLEEWLKVPAMIAMGPLKFIISSSPRHNVYGCDFGWGKPVTVRSGKGQKFDGKMTVFPAAEPGGIDVEVCLAPETLKTMESDEEFMESVSY